MKKLYFFGIIAVVFLSGCSPRVTTRDVTKFYVNPIGIDDVIVYEIGQPIADSVEIIGSVSVTDRGFSSDITYNEAVDLAKQKVVWMGGDGLVITDHVLSFWTESINQIKGQIIYFPDTDTVTNVEKPNPLILSAQKKKEKPKKWLTPADSLPVYTGYGLWFNPIPKGKMKIETGTIIDYSKWSNSLKIANKHDVHDVIVYEMGQSVPNSAEIIGMISVTDKSSSSDITYDEALELAKQEVVKLGGNGLAISLPFCRESTPQIAGQVLYLTDTIIDTEKPKPVLISALNIEEIYKKRKTPTHTFYADIGYSVWLSPLSFSKVQILPVFGGIVVVDYSKELWKSNAPEIKYANSVEWHLGYDWMPSKWSIIGFGAMYTGQVLNYHINDINDIKYNISYNYIAPQFILKGKVGTRFIFKGALGIGYTFYKYTSSYSMYRYTLPYVKTLNFTEHCLGTNILLGMDYQISNNWGIGLNFNFVTVYFPKDFREESANSLSANIGARYFF